MQLKHDLARDMNRIPAALAEVVRATCPKDEFTQELRATFLGTGWNPEQVCWPFNGKSRSCKVRGLHSANKIVDRLGIPEEMLEAEVEAEVDAEELRNYFYTVL